MKNNEIINVSRILSANGTWSIDENGKLTIRELKVKGTAEFDGKTKFGTPESPQGITIYDEITKQPGCIRLINGVLETTKGECDMNNP